MARCMKRGQTFETVTGIEVPHLGPGNGFESKAAGLHIQILNEEVITLMQVGRALPKVLQFLGGADMVEVGVGVQQGLHTEARLLDPGANFWAFTARIHHDSSAGIHIPQQAAVATEGTHREGIKFQHDPRLNRLPFGSPSPAEELPVLPTSA